MSKRKRNLLNCSILRLKEIAQDNDWRVREDVGFELRARTEEDFEQNCKVINEWLKNHNENIRRAAVIGCMVRKHYGTSKIIAQIMTLLEQVLNDPSVYVRRNTGPFVIGYLGYTYPETVLPILIKWAQQYKNSNEFHACWNIVSSFSQALGRRHPQTALKVMRIFSSHPHYIVQRSVTKCLINISKTALHDTALLCQDILKASPSNVIAKRTLDKIDFSIRDQSHG